MKTYLLNLWDALRTSYWFVPSLFAAGTLVLFWVSLVLQPIVVEAWTFMPSWLLSRADTARAILSAVAGAFVAVTGTVFSITIVILSLASQQFGPRLLRRFMYDLPTQVTLGIFLCTGFYSLLSLAAVEATDANLFKFHLAVMFTFLLTVVSMLTLVFFIHNVAMLIQAPHVVAGVASDLNASILRIFPEELKHGDGDQNPEANQKEEWEPCAEGNFTISCAQDGYIQAIDDDNLMEIAVDWHVALRFYCRPGDFVARGVPIVEIGRRGPRPLPADRLKELRKLVNECIITGLRRTPRQDVECAVLELVEVAVRSLSPGINDPFTAMNCVDYLGASLAFLAKRRFPGPVKFDGEGVPRIYIPPATFSGVFASAFNQIRQYSRGSVAVSIRLLDALTLIAGQLEREDDRQVLRTHADMIIGNVAGWPEPADVDDAQERYARVILLLGEKRGDFSAAEILQ